MPEPGCNYFRRCLVYSIVSVSWCPEPFSAQGMVAPAQTKTRAACSGARFAAASEKIWRSCFRRGPRFRTDSARFRQEFCHVLCVLGRETAHERTHLRHRKHMDCSTWTFVYFPRSLLRCWLPFIDGEGWGDLFNASNGQNKSQIKAHIGLVIWGERPSKCDAHVN